MGRPIVLSNGQMHIGLNCHGIVHDFYYPYVGYENHSAGREMRHRVGIWTDGTISWLDDGSWSVDFSYHANALIGHIVAKNEQLQLLLEFDDAVDHGMNAFIRNIHVVNLSSKPREVRLFMHQAFAIGNSRGNTDTGQYLPDSNALLHYHGRRAFVVSGSLNGRPFDQHSVGLFGIESHEGTYRDADDGELSMGNVEHGRVDSMIRFTVALGGFNSQRVQYWIAAGKSTREALDVHKQMLDDGIGVRLAMTEKSWQAWLKPATSITVRLPREWQDGFIKSLLIVKAHIDRNGAIIASSDSTMLNYSRDAYAYCWPRDGAFIIWPLIRMGYTEEPRRFFEFCRQQLHPNGYLMHKFRADGALGSSWHPYVHEDGIIGPPIQEDETAITLFVFGQFYSSVKDRRLLTEYYDTMIKPMGDFMAGYLHDTGLPRPSYDLWEERYMISTYTTAVTHAALIAAAELAEAYDDKSSSVAWRSVASDMKAAAHKHLFNKSRGAFYKGLVVSSDALKPDETIDVSSFYGAFMFGLFSADSEEIKKTAETIASVFSFKPDTTGLPRYEDDNYHRESHDAPSNYWPVTTLWMAQYWFENGHEELTKQSVEWVRGHMFKTGVLPEQIMPHDGSPTSVAPLTWSQAEYLSTLLDIMYL